MYRVLFLVVALVLAGCSTALQDAPKPAPIPAASRWLQLDPVTVWFDYGSAELSLESQNAIGAAVERAKKARQSFRVRVLVTGHTDEAEARNEDPNLSRMRAEAVRAELIVDGMHDIDINVDARGGNAPAVPTTLGVREPLNRRVEIRFVD